MLSDETYIFQLPLVPGVQCEPVYLSAYSLKDSSCFSRILEQQPILSFAADIYDSWIIHVSDVTLMTQPLSTLFTLTFQSRLAFI